MTHRLVLFASPPQWLALTAMACALLPVGAGAQAPSQSTDEAFFRHASSCVAVLKADAETLLATAAREGQTGVKPQLEAVTAQGFAFIGTAYKRGLRNPKADALLASAQAEVQAMAAPARAALSAQCQSEGRQLLADANVIERALVENRARARVERSLNKAKK